MVSVRGPRGNGRTSVSELIKQTDGNYSLTKFKKLPQSEQIAVLDECWDNVRNYFATGRMNESLYYSMEFMPNALKEIGVNPKIFEEFFNYIHANGGASHLLQGLEKFKQKIYDPGLLDQIAEFENAIKKDPLFYTSKGTHHGASLQEYNARGIDIDNVDPKHYDALGTRIESTSKDVPVNSEVSAEPSAKAISNEPINTAPSAETPPGVLTEPPAKLPEVNKQTTPPNVGRTIEEAEAEAYPPIDVGRIGGYNSPTSPGVHIRVINAEGKPVDLTPEEITKFNPNTASPSPEAIGEAMREAVVRNNTNLVGDTSLKPEDKPAFLTKEGGSLPKKEEVKVTEDAAKATPETSEKDGALTGKVDEKPKGIFSRIGSYINRNKGKYIFGTAGLTGLGFTINDLASKDSTIKSWFTENHSPLDAKNPSTNQPHIKSLDQREGAYMPERLLRFKQNTQEPFANNTDIIVDTGSTPINEELPAQQQEQQPRVVNAPTPVNNATADYVRAAYNSYIPSDAGRAYQKAIYGDPLELDRMRLQQQQQQKWRDFVMRSGQSPAELVQRGLMPYDALQYV